MTKKFCGNKLHDYVHTKYLLIELSSEDNFLNRYTVSTN